MYPSHDITFFLYKWSSMENENEMKVSGIGACEKLCEREYTKAETSTFLRLDQVWEHHNCEVWNLSILYCAFHPLSTNLQKKIPHDSSSKALYQFYQEEGHFSWIFWQMDGCWRPFSCNLWGLVFLGVVLEDNPKQCSVGHCWLWCSCSPWSCK